MFNYSLDYVVLLCLYSIMDAKDAQEQTSPEHLKGEFISVLKKKLSDEIKEDKNVEHQVAYLDDFLLNRPDSVSDTSTFSFKSTEGNEGMEKFVQAVRGGIVEMDSIKPVMVKEVSWSLSTKESSEAPVLTGELAGFEAKTMFPDVVAHWDTTDRKDNRNLSNFFLRRKPSEQ